MRNCVGLHFIKKSTLATHVITQISQSLIQKWGHTLTKGTPAHSHACTQSLSDVKAIGCSVREANSRRWLLMATGSRGEMSIMTMSLPANQRLKWDRTHTLTGTCASPLVHFSAHAQSGSGEKEEQFSFTKVLCIIRAVKKQLSSRGDFSSRSDVWTNDFLFPFACSTFNLCEYSVRFKV